MDDHPTDAPISSGKSPPIASASDDSVLRDRINIISAADSETLVTTVLDSAIAAARCASNEVNSGNGEQLHVEAAELPHPVDNVLVSLVAESAFRCKFPGCEFASRDAEEYLKHEDSHVEGGAVACDVCNVSFATYAKMRRHHLYIHQGIRTFECQFCTKRFLRKEQFVEHLVKHSKPCPYQCGFCGGSFPFRAQLKSHINAEHSNVIVGKMCHLCDFTASTANAVKVHYATFHLKQSSATDLSRDVNGNLHLSQNGGAIDLAAVSQNFSFMAAHYPSYTATMATTAGPSDLSQRSKVMDLTPATSYHNIAHVLEQNPNPSALLDTSNHRIVVTSVAGSTEDNHRIVVTSVAGSTVVSPTVRTVSPIQTPSRECPVIKPEPTEIETYVQPTSTMDLSTSEVVETTSEVPCRRKSLKSSGEISENRLSPSSRHFEFHSTPQSSAETPHTCCRFRPYEMNPQCNRHNRHHFQHRRTRFSDSDLDRSAQQDSSDEDRKVFCSRATSTRWSVAASNQAGEARDSYFAQKNYAIREDEGSAHTCIYCGIIFPDQTLYLLHRSLHSESSPWKCNLCGKNCKDKYDFNSHVISKGHF